ncbi:hypothetical protein QFC24_004295 [Naganishia onofrii]|uniref:Uncharacterized protein n=1 Tax=Naganishia onofrii TaxID=1851511 RepID=A0ACC2XE13_9TREE|nr:hypothetical protein QFC24_004295 [Naganishia onofrii]
MSLADELLNDLDGLSDEEVPQEASTSASGSGLGAMGPPALPTNGKRKADADANADDDDDEDDELDNALSGNNGASGSGAADNGVDGSATMADGTSAAGYVGAGGTRPAEELDREDVEGMDLKDVQDVEAVVKLQKSKKLLDILQRIEHYTAHPEDTSVEAGPIEENPEYALIVQANNLSVELENELLLVHKFIRDHYAIRFPELEQVIGDPWEYISAVKAIGNAEDLTKPSTPLTGRHVLGVSMTASISRGRLLQPREWQVIERAMEVAFELRNAREKIFSYVESRMNVLAPNLSAIISTNIAAKLLGVAGGLATFAKTPADNVFLFGALKKTLQASHLSAASQQRHTGFIYQSPLVQSAPPEYRRKAQKTVAAKCVLAARVDLERQSRDGSYGKQEHDKLVAYLIKMAEPPPTRLIKALPIPQETNRKKRGGKRARRQKEAYAQTELRKLQNRMAFGEVEQETGAFDETVGMGMIGSSTGRVRAEAIDSKSRAKMSKANKLRTQLLGGRSQSSNSNLSGTQTSLSFTPVQGIEIVTPSLAKAQADRVAAANDRWFAAGTFTHVPKQKSNIPGQDKSAS